MATVTHTVQQNETLNSIAAKYNTTADNIAKLNGITNHSLICVGQILVISGKSSTDKPISYNLTQETDTTVGILAFGLQTGTDRTLFISWGWSKHHTDRFKVLWKYATGDGVDFVGSNEEIAYVEKATQQSTYSAPDNAYRIDVFIKPIAKTHKVNDVDVAYWTADWSTGQTFYFSETPRKPNTPTVTIEGLKMHMRVENLTYTDNQIEFRIIKNDIDLYHTITVNRLADSASAICSIAPGHRYKVQCRTKNGNICSDWSEYSSSYSTVPERPVITYCEGTSETTIRLAWNCSGDADSYEIQYANREDYLYNSNSTSSVSNITTKQYILTGLQSGETYYIRVRASNKEGNSEWSSSVMTVIGKPPAAPTTWSSTTTAVVGENVILYWVHNAKDGSKEKYAELEMYINGTTYTYKIENANYDNPDEDTTGYYTLVTGSDSDIELRDGASISWRVRTAGVTNIYGDWSILRVIDVYAPPTLSIQIQNKDNESIDSLRSFPFRIVGEAGPDTQSPIGYYIMVIAKSAYETVNELGNVTMINKGDEVYSKFYDITEELSLKLYPGDINLENNVTYEVNVSVTMNSGLVAMDIKEFTVAWQDEMNKPNAEIGINREDLSAYIRPYCGRYIYKCYKVRYDATLNRYYRTNIVIDDIQGESVDGAFTVGFDDIVYSDGTTYFYTLLSDEQVLVEDVTLSVYRREYDGGFTLISSGIKNTDGAFVIDPHPSLDYARYRIVAISDITGAVSYTDVPGYLVGEKSVVIQWNEAWNNFDVVGDELQVAPTWSGSMIKLPYNIDISEEYATDVTLVKYIGRSRPVSYYGTQLESNATWNMDIDKKDKNTLYALRRLAIWTGDVYVREPSGSGYWANISVSFGQTHCEPVIPVTLTLTRVEGGI